MFWLEIPGLVGTNTIRGVHTSHQKYEFSSSSSSYFTSTHRQIVFVVVEPSYTHMEKKMGELNNNTTKKINNINQ